MRKMKLGVVLLITTVLAVGLLAGCTQTKKQGNLIETNEGSETSEGRESKGESGESGEGHGSESGEEGDPSSPILTLTESWDGVVNGVRVKMSYDMATETFSGIAENSTNQTLKGVLVELNLKQDTKTVVELGPYPVGDLTPGQQAKVVLKVADEPEAKGVTFNAWEIHPEVGGAGEAAGEGGESHGSEGSEGSGEGGESHGSEGPEGIEGNESANGISINEAYDIKKNGGHLIIKYDSKSNSFVGTVTNVTKQTLTRARVEVHTSAGDEFGPTTPTDIAPGKTLSFSIPANGKAFDTWTTHAEFGAAEGNEGGANTEGREGGGEGSETHGNEGSSEGKEN